jgi:antibiotic biosynthesis monooxygenase (ABM) superfamily enzyme
VPPDAVDWFMDWQRGVTAAAEGFPGYRATDIYPPTESQGDQWVITLQFDEPTSLQKWLDSPKRAEWVTKLKDRASTFNVEMLPGGFGAWFTGARGAGGAKPPAWKIVLSVVLALFPTVVFINFVVGSQLNKLGFAFSMLVGNFLSVSMLQWIVTPPLTKFLQPWLKANETNQRTLSLGGLVGILGGLILLAVSFRLTGITPS